MKINRKHTTLVGAITLAALSLSQTAAADHHRKDPSAMAHGSAILNGNVSNGLNVFGGVSDVILNEDSNAVEYVLFDISDTYTPFTDSAVDESKVFAESSNIELVPDTELRGWNVVVEDTSSHRKPEELTITRTEADHRLLSNVLDNNLYFSDDQEMAIEDVLIDPDNGEIAYYTVEIDSESFFDTEVRSIPATEVNVGMNGRLSVEMPLSAIEENSQYQLSAR